MSAEPQGAALPPPGGGRGGALARLTLPRSFSFRGAARLLGAFVVTNVLFAILVELLGSSYSKAFQAMWDGAFGSQFNFGQTLMIASLLVTTGLAAAIPFRAQLWNVGGEGQMWFGAFATIGIALNLPGGMPTGVSVAILVVAAMIAGALWGSCRAC